MLPESRDILVLNKDCLLPLEARKNQINFPEGTLAVFDRYDDMYNRRAKQVVLVRFIYTPVLTESLEFYEKVSGRFWDKKQTTGVRPHDIDFYCAYKDIAPYWKDQVDSERVLTATSHQYLLDSLKTDMKPTITVTNTRKVKLL